MLVNDEIEFALVKHECRWGLCSAEYSGIICWVCHFFWYLVSKCLILINYVYMKRIFWQEIGKRLTKLQLLQTMTINNFGVSAARYKLGSKMLYFLGHERHPRRNFCCLREKDFVK